VVTLSGALQSEIHREVITRAQKADRNSEKRRLLAILAPGCQRAWAVEYEEAAEVFVICGFLLHLERWNRS